MPFGSGLFEVVDVASNRTSLIDSEGNETLWTYDGFHRVIEEENELGKSRFFEYAQDGWLHLRTDRNGRVIEFTYDDLGRLVLDRGRGTQACGKRRNSPTHGRE